MSRCWTLLLALAATACSAQHPWSLGINAHHGFLWPHRPASWILVEGHAPGLELFAERTVRGDRAWHHRFLLPSYGVAVLGSGLGATRLGFTLRAVPYLHFPFHRWRRSSIGMRTGWGLGYVDKPFHPEHNRQQVAIGSRINTAIQLAVEFRLERGRWMVLGGLGIDHWSNGAARMPNLGLNYLSVHVGTAYRFGGVEAPAVVLDTAANTGRRSENMVIFAGGIHETGQPQSGRHGVFSLTAQRQWTVSPRSALAAGVDVFNKGAWAGTHAELKDRPRAAATQFGVHGGYALLLGHGELFMQMGAYVYTPVPDERPVFHRMGGRLRMGRYLMASVALKSHFAVADHWEFGLGCRW